MRKERGPARVIALSHIFSFPYYLSDFLLDGEGSEAWRDTLPYPRLTQYAWVLDLGMSGLGQIVEKKQLKWGEVCFGRGLRGIMILHGGKACWWQQVKVAAGSHLRG